jgi:hypothetical protein
VAISEIQLSEKKQEIFMSHIFKASDMRRFAINPTVGKQLKWNPLENKAIKPKAQS